MDSSLFSEQRDQNPWGKHTHAASLPPPHHFFDFELDRSALKLPHIHTHTHTHARSQAFASSSVVPSFLFMCFWAFCFKQGSTRLQITLLKINAPLCFLVPVVLPGVQNRNQSQLRFVTPSTAHKQYRNYIYVGINERNIALTPSRCSSKLQPDWRSVLHEHTSTPACCMWNKHHPSEAVTEMEHFTINNSSEAL